MIIFSVLSWSLLLIWQLNLLLNTTHIQKRFKKISVCFCLCLLVFFVFLLYDIVCSSYVPSPGTIQAIWQRDESHGGGGIPETGDALVSGLHLPSHPHLSDHSDNSSAFNLKLRFIHSFAHRLLKNIKGAGGLVIPPVGYTSNTLAFPQGG